jgi:hypothetical protein
LEYPSGAGSKLPPSSKKPWGLSAPESDHPHREPDRLGRGFLLLAKLSPCYSDLDPKSKVNKYDARSSPASC